MRETLPGDRPGTGTHIPLNGRMRHSLSLSSFDATVDQLVEAARLAESVGFDAVWTYDHLSGSVVGKSSTVDPWVTLAAIAIATDHIALGPLVINAAVRNPARTAIATSTLQQVAGARVTLGLGAGAGNDPFGAELTMVGLPVLGAAERRRRVEEAATVIRAVWRGIPDVTGTHFGLTGATGFVHPSPEPPIVVGANGPKMAAVAGRVADGVVFHHTEEDLHDLVTIARESSSADRFSVTVEADLDDDCLTGPGHDLMEAIGTDIASYRWNPSLGLDAISRAADVLGLG